MHEQELVRLPLTKHINLIETLYNIFKEYDHSKLDKDVIKYIEKEHKILVEKFGAKILKILAHALEEKYLFKAWYYNCVCNNYRKPYRL
jgi:hypothetical protein